MKNLFAAWICIILLTPGYNANSQTFRIHTGINLANMEVDTDEKTQINPGLLLGVSGELSISRYISLEAGLLRAPKGFKLVSTEEVSGVTKKEKYLFGPNYADFFINAKGTFDRGDIRLFCTAGTYAGTGIGGREKTISYADGDKTSTSYRDLVWGSAEESDIRRYDFGVSIGAGIEFKAIQVRIFYQHGLPDVSPNEESWQELKNRTVGISAGFRIAG